MSGIVLFLTLLLAGSVVHKALARERLSVSAARLVGGGPLAGVLVLAMAGTLELMAALALLVTPLKDVGAILAAAIWGGYALALLLRKGETLDCGCDFSSRERPVGWFAIIRPVVLSVVALGTTAMAEAEWSIDAPFAAAAMLALYLAAAELAAAAPHRKGMTV